MDLPVVGNQAPERADAARNRARILAAAERLFAERGVANTSLEAIAEAAGVGNATLFRRFGDRPTLAVAVLDRSERELQDGFLRGPPPLGPGAPPCERIIAFGAAMLDHLELNGEVLLDAERSGRAPGYMRSAPFAVRWMHVRNLVAEARPDSDADYTADVLLLPLSAAAFFHMRHDQEMPLSRLKRNYADLVERVMAGGAERGPS